MDAIAVIRERFTSIRLDHIRRVSRVSELHPINQYSIGSPYYRWLTAKMDFFGINYCDCNNVHELEARYMSLCM